MSNIKASFNNTADQKVVIGLTGFSDRMFRDDECKTEKKIDSMYF